MLKVGGIYQERHYDTLYFVVIEDADLHMFSYDLYIKSDTMTRDVVCQVLHAQDGFSDFSYDTKRYIALRADGYLGQVDDILLKKNAKCTSSKKMVLSKIGKE